MKYIEAIKVVSDNSKLIGKQIKYKDDLYSVVDIFPCPIQEAPRNFFTKKYSEIGRKLTVEHFMSGVDLDISLYCDPVKRGIPIIIPLDDVQILK